MLLNVVLLSCLLLIAVGSWKAIRLLMNRRQRQRAIFSVDFLLETQQALAEKALAPAHNPMPAMPVREPSALPKGADPELRPGSGLSDIERITAHHRRHAATVRKGGDHEQRQSFVQAGL